MQGAKQADQQMLHRLRIGTKFALLFYVAPFAQIELAPAHLGLELIKTAQIKNTYLSTPLLKIRMFLSFPYNIAQRIKKIVTLALVLRTVVSRKLAKFNKSSLV